MKIKRILIVIVLTTMGGVIALGLQSLFSDDTEELLAEYNQTPSKTVNYPISTSNNTPDFTVAAEHAVDAVVHVKTLTETDNNQAELYSFFFGNPNLKEMPRRSSGSGVIISTDGYIVTNNHVIKNADEIEVVLNDNRSFKGKLIGKDPATDVALIKIEAKNLSPISYGNSDELKIGEWVLAVGNPFNLTSTVTAGIVSAKARNINILQERYAVESFIQTDAAVNPGNSGGALVNTQGELVGINTAIASQTGSYSGYSFAIPVNIVKKIVADLTEYGTVQRAMLGVSIRNIDSQLAEKLKLAKPEGVYIMGVGDESAAKEAGIISEDIILKINDIKVKNVPELQEQISKFSPGDKITVWLKRKGNLKKFVVTLKNSMGNTNIVERNDISVLGASFKLPKEKMLNDLNLSSGVQVDGLSSGKLLKAGVRKGFIITTMNRKKISAIEDIRAVLNHSQGGIYIEGVYPNGTTGYYAFGLK
ncbi:MAG: Do family serine endopeptidase [Bacteroidota bacterium]|nr:Do family serine endopeptidase [Bacteroidota bacterium]